MRGFKLTTVLKATSTDDDGMPPSKSMMEIRKKVEAPTSPLLKGVATLADVRGKL